MMNADKHTVGGNATAITAFDFHGDRLDVVPMPNGDVGVSLRRLCEAVPVDFAAQRRRLAREATKGARWAVVVKMATAGADGKTYTMLVLPRRAIPMWAATVELGMVDEAARPGIAEKLARYQDECAEVLADRFIGPRSAAGGITIEQIAQIAGAVCMKLIEELVMPELRRIAAQATGQGATVTGLQVEDLRIAIDLTARALLAIGDYEKPKAARMAVLNHVVAVSGWGGPGRRRHLMPAAVYPVVMASLSAWRKALDRRMARRRVRALAPAQGTLFGTQEPAKA